MIAVPSIEMLLEREEIAVSPSTSSDPTVNMKMKVMGMNGRHMPNYALQIDCCNLVTKPANGRNNMYTHPVMRVYIVGQIPNLNPTYISLKQSV